MLQRQTNDSTRLGGGSKRGKEDKTMRQRELGIKIAIKQATSKTNGKCKEKNNRNNKRRENKVIEGKLKRHEE